MKPLQIGLLVAAGAVGGALVMKWQSTHHPAPVPVAAAPAAPAVPAAPPAPQPVATPAEQPAPEPPAPAAELPSPVPEKNKPVHHKPAPAPRPAPAVIAQNDAPAPVPQPAPPAPAPEPARPPVPPVRTAPAPIQEPAREPAAPPAAPEPNQVTLAAGTLIPIRLIDGLSSERNLPGDTFSAVLDAPLGADGFVIAERGARVEGKVVEAARAGKISGVASLAIVLTRLTTSDGQHVAIQTQMFTKRADSSHREDAAKIGAGAGLGAIIGAIAGGGKGAAIGAGVGGAAGAGDVLLTRGRPATLPSETRINFRMSAPVTLTERR